MQAVENLLRELEERVIAQRIDMLHDNVRASYPLAKNIVDSFDEFVEILSDYYNYHYQAVFQTGPLKKLDAQEQAKDLVQQIYRKNGEIVTAFRDCTDGLNGGLRIVLDRIAEGMKYQHSEQYVTSVFDRYVQPHDWDMKVEIIRQFINVYGTYLTSDIQKDQPERYATNYRTLIRSYMDGRKKMDSEIRRL